MVTRNLGPGRFQMMQQTVNENDFFSVEIQLTQLFLFIRLNCRYAMSVRM